MKKEDARLTLQENFGHLSQEHPRILEALRVALDALSQPSLPSNLDEAAKESAKKWRKNPDGTESRELFFAPYIRGFKVGAKWMAGQGYTKEGIARPDDCEIWVNLTGTDIKDGDKVIVQVRKK